MAKKLNVLIVGAGGREHALLWKLMQSPLVGDIYCAPGNGGTKLMARNVPIPVNNTVALASWASQNKIDLTIVGPESPLLAGIVDLFQSLGLAIFGPVSQAAQIEGSKAWARELMRRHHIPSPNYAIFNSPSEALEYIEKQPCPIVVKADGLAMGKGSIVAQDHQEARAAVQACMEEKVFGEAGEVVVVEEYLTGMEVSLLAFTDGVSVIPMVAACDYKRAYDNDEGPNTGGMGGYAPPHFMDAALVQTVVDTILQPVVDGLRQEGCLYRGVLYAGLMLTGEGPKVLEFNCRFGDPETQVILPLLASDILEPILAVVEGRLEGTKLEWSGQASCGVVLAAEGYPGPITTGYPISGLEALEPGVLPFHAGTTRERGQLVTAGGRVLTLVATGPTVAAARRKVYANAPKVRFEGCSYRRDIGAREETSG